MVAEASTAQPLSSQPFVLEHPKGQIEVALSYRDGDPAKGEDAGPVFDRAGIIRTAKKIMAGEIYVPAQLLDPAQRATTKSACKPGRCEARYSPSGLRSASCVRASTNGRPT